ncbi:Eco57I restriction-modification methylase domain-containing protein [Candidatus Spongiihabitans sp.]|uniref:Eco57I restriction-modification methylase domain-containing protein n=1 Tax=Candidatus Spongiihabitans sp. TaxID=3101308 RepID=UPI003C701644
MQTAERYSHVESRKKEGAHYTPEIFSDFISENIIFNANLKKSVKVVDPAVGDGELLISLIKTLKAKSFHNIEVYGFDTNPASIEITRKRLKETYPNLTPILQNKDFLQICIEKSGLSDSQDLFYSSDIPDFDLLIANPPYIRTQVLGAEQSQLLSKNFGLKGRVDIYQAFLVAMKSVLKPDGVAGVIVSNRFLTTKGAGKFREIIHNQYSIKGIWDFGDTKVFEAAVLPAVVILSTHNKERDFNIPFSSIYMAENESYSKSLPFVESQIQALKYDGIVSSKQGNFYVKNGHLTFDSNPADLWRLQDVEYEQWLDKVASNTWCLFKDIGKVRVGVKTTADNVFIRSNWKKEIGYEPELLRPLTTHHIASRFRSNEKEKKVILYTHTIINGKRHTFNINEYPLSKRYLEENKDQLSSRKYVIKANREWFEIWVPQNPSLWEQPKVVFRDISERPTFWMDKEGSIVNGDCYWLLRDNEQMPESIMWLVLAVANSRFIEKFYDIKFHNKLYSNRRRFITQYVEQFPIPNPNLAESKTLIALAKECYKEKNENNQINIEDKIDKIVWSVFNVS